MSNVKYIHGVEIRETEEHKIYRSENYNMNFNKITGFMQRWGKTKDEDPEYNPFPEILDIEITTVCNGPNNKLCPFCYKSNNPNGHNMTFDQFKNIIDKMPFLTQIALGADAQGITNPDMFKMMSYARSKGIVPNLTIADVSDDVAKKLANVAGAVAVSVYKHAGYDVAFNSVEKLAKHGMEQINLHFMLSKKTINQAYEVIDAIKNDNRLKSINAIVFLSLKQKGRGVKFDYINKEEYKKLVNHCLENGIPFGFDSCSAPTFLDSVKDNSNYNQFKELSEDCESTVSSSYINEKGEFFPCSFTEGWTEGGWGMHQGINVLEANDFIKDVWLHPKTNKFRDELINNKDDNDCRNCPAYAVCGKDMRLYKDLEIINLS